MKPTARIVSYNLYGERVCASAAKISTTLGNSLELFDSSDDVEKNRKLINKVMSSGHTSLIEHAVFSIAFANVSAFVEQYFIEERLASFTVKSRRYVDFSSLGYYTPDELDDNNRAFYIEYMNMLYKAYESLLKLNIPKEDARFLLPYSFNSNFYCTLNARELSQIIFSIEHGRGRGISELAVLVDQIKEQVNAISPCFLFEITQDVESDPIDNQYKYARQEQRFIDYSKSGNICMINAPSHPKTLLTTAYQIGHPLEQMENVIQLLSSHRPRELEQLSYTFSVADISLSGITHIVRHRMQSIIVPPLQSISDSRMIVPKSVQNNIDAIDIYNNVVLEARKMRAAINDNEILGKYGYYFLLSGTLTNIITTMNARELLHFVQLRSCNRAQWEIRNISIRMLNLARTNFAELFNQIGPSCFVRGFCPEGKMTCGKLDEVKLYFTNREDIDE